MWLAQTLPLHPLRLLPRLPPLPPPLLHPLHPGARAIFPTVSAFLANNIICGKHAPINCTTKNACTVLRRARTCHGAMRVSCTRVESPPPEYFTQSRQEFTGLARIHRVHIANNCLASCSPPFSSFSCLPSLSFSSLVPLPHHCSSGLVNPGGRAPSPSTRDQCVDGAPSAVVVWLDGRNEGVAPTIESVVR